jgi:hypothetical protein
MIQTEAQKDFVDFYEKLIIRELSGWGRQSGKTVAITMLQERLEELKNDL